MTLPVASLPSPFTLAPLPVPDKWPGGNRSLLLGAGTFIEPLKRLELFSDKEYETFTLQWVHGYLAKKLGYDEVQIRGGSGDKGRDIVAWRGRPGMAGSSYDNYQCKHYESPLGPTKFWLELGKLCYYTYTGVIPVPANYFVVASKGVSTLLQDKIDDPASLKDGLIANWGTYCKSDIVKGKANAIELDKGLLDYIEKFNFSIVSSLKPHDCLEYHSHTIYHPLVFGLPLKQRVSPPPPPTGIAAEEMVYVRCIYDAFSENLKHPVNSIGDFVTKSRFVTDFEKARVCFYSTESLKEFSRDNDLDESHFGDLLNEFHNGLFFRYTESYPDGYAKMRSVCEASTSLSIDENILRNQLKQNDRIGICHHLANAGRMVWKTDE
jgi:hypothetical protein